MRNALIIVRQSSSLRQITEAEVLQALSERDQEAKHIHLNVSANHFTDAVDQGDWSGHDAFLRVSAAKIRDSAEQNGGSEIHYFGLAEVPHIVSLGAHVGSEYAVQFHDFDRDKGTWAWNTTEQTVELNVVGLEDLQRNVKARGAAVIRVAISSAISDFDVRAAVGDETLADVVITHALPTVPIVALIKSQADVDAVRRRFREVYGALRNARPNLDAVHVFLAAPPSVCFAVGQELNLRNAPPIQTYRFRKSTDSGSQLPAILLTAFAEGGSFPALSDNDVLLAEKIRTRIWPEALKDIETFVANKQADNPGARLWFASHVAKEELRQVAAYLPLPSIASLVKTSASVDPEPFLNDYGFDQDGSRWRLGDRLLAGLSSAVGGDEESLRQLIRLFLFHEYLHLYQGLTKHTAEEIGKFANCLEHMDYAADAYAILHQWDLMRYQNGRLVPPAFQEIRAFLADQIELAICSFWAFDAAAGDEWQVRRIRRYLNWYWRMTQIRNAADMAGIVRLLSRQPHIEIGGLRQITRGRRVVALLDQLDKTTHLEIAIVREDERIFRISDGPNTNLPALIGAFRKGEHASIKEFFRSVYDLVSQSGGSQPATSEETNA